MIFNPDMTEYAEPSIQEQSMVKAIDECGKVALIFLSEGKPKEKMGALACIDRLSVLLPKKRQASDLVHMQELRGNKRNPKDICGYISPRSSGDWRYSQSKSGETQITRQKAEVYATQFPNYDFIIENA